MRYDAGHLLPLDALGLLGLRTALGLLLEDEYPHRGLPVHYRPALYAEIVYPHLGAYGNLQHTAFLYGLYPGHYARHQGIQVRQAVQSLPPEDRGQGLVVAAHLPFRTDSEQTGAREILHRPVKRLAVIPEPPLAGHKIPHPVEQDVEYPVLEKGGVLGKVKGQVPVLESTQQVVELADIAPVDG